MDAPQEDRPLTRNDDLDYPIVIAPSVGAELRRYLRDRCDETIVLCDREVAALADRLTRRVRGRRALVAFDLGERRKTLNTIESVLNKLVECGTQRTTTVIGVGGGVAADLFGFAASIYMRGIAYVSVATSLVAMVDAAIGGKTGVNLKSGKNLAGTFRDPVAVFCHVDALQTLPYARLRDGLAEVIKTAVIEGDDLFERLEKIAARPFPAWPWERVIEDAVKVKTMLVADDRLEAGARETLNLGHTFAHAIERASRYRLSHGAAVAIGLRAAGLLALATGRFSRAEQGRLLTVLALVGLPLHARCAREDISAAMAVDKKRRRGALRFVLPRAIGDVEYGVEVPARSLARTLASCVTAPDAREFV